MDYQEYNEKQFAAKANKNAMIMWLALSTILSIAYAIEVVKDAVPADPDYCMF